MFCENFKYSNVVIKVIMVMLLLYQSIIPYLLFKKIIRLDRHSGRYYYYYPDGSILKTGFSISSRLRRTMKIFLNSSF